MYFSPMRWPHFTSKVFKLHICKYIDIEKEIGGKAMYLSNHILYKSFQITHAPLL